MSSNESQELTNLLLGAEGSLDLIAIRKLHEYLIFSELARSFVNRMGIQEAILPRDNEKDLPEVPEVIRKDMKLHLVDSMDDVLKIALEREVTPLVPVPPPAADKAVRPVDDITMH